MSGHVLAVALLALASAPATASILVDRPQATDDAPWLQRRMQWIRGRTAGLGLAAPATGLGRHACTPRSRSTAQSSTQRNGAIVRIR